MRLKVVIVFLAALLCLPCPTQAQREKKRSDKIVVAVMELDRGTGVDAEAGEYLTQQVEDAIFRMGQYKLVSRGQIKKVLKEQALQQTGCTDQSCVAEVGRMLNAEKVVSGKVTKWGGSYQVSLKLIDVTLGMIDSSGLGKCSKCEGDSDSVGMAVSDAVAALFGVETAKSPVTKIAKPLPTPDSWSGRAGIEWVYSQPAGLYFTRSEVTLGQFQKCVSAGGCKSDNKLTKSDNKYCNWGQSGRDNHPMNCVNWYGADEFCKWAGGRLPTEDEWYMEASNSGTRQYPWGDHEVTCDYAVWGDGSNTDGCGRDSTWPVCSKRAGDSVSGLCDMSGNVWEWTSSADGSARVVRGGAWDHFSPDSLLASPSNWADSSNNYGGSGGFRCVRLSH